MRLQRSFRHLAAPLAIIIPAVLSAPAEHKRQTSSPTFTSLGCWTDRLNPRPLVGSNYADDGMTIGKCADYCSAYQYFGVEYGRECYCGNVRDTQISLKDPSTCTMPCGGSGSEICGGPALINLYRNDAYVPVSLSVPAGYQYSGCYNDTVWARALRASSTAANTMTVEVCATFCNGAAYFGVEYGQECYCGNTLENGSVKQKDDSACAMSCAGSSNEKCGGPGVFNLYQNTNYAPVTKTVPDGYEYLGCFNDTVWQRALVDSADIFSAMTIEECATFCNGAAFFGLEYGDECYCGKTLENGSVKQAEGDCSFACAGNSKEICGAGNRMNLYHNKASPLPSTITSPSTSSTDPSGPPSVTTTSDSSTATSSSDSSTATTSSDVSSATDPSVSPSGTGTSDPPSETGTDNPPSDPSTGPSYPGYTFEGCYTDSVGARVLNQKAENRGDMTLETCAGMCSGYNYFGLENGGECYCGSSYANPTTKVDEDQCSTECNGDSSEVCGGRGFLTVFKSITDRAAHVAVVPGYTYQGCYSDTVANRVLVTDVWIDGHVMTAASCASFCSSYTNWGLEWGEECWCANGFTASTQKMDESGCSYPCTGAINEICGGTDRITVYQKN